MKRSFWLLSSLLFACRGSPARDVATPPRAAAPAPVPAQPEPAPSEAAAVLAATTSTPLPHAAPAGRDCAATSECSTEGKCRGVVETGCRAGSDADCARSTACADRGACRLLEGVCARDCRDLADCRETGRCTADHRSMCVATRTEDCRKSRLCREGADCTLSPTLHTCVPGSVADCERKEECRGGRCIFFASACHVKHPCVCNFGSGTACDEFGDASGERPSCPDFSRLVEQCVAAGGPRPMACPKFK